MPDNLAVAADGVRGLEVVVFFGHFFSGTDEDGFHPGVEDFIVGAERTLGSLLSLAVRGPLRSFGADTSGAASIYAVGSRFISGGLFRQQNSSPPSGPYREPEDRRNARKFMLQDLPGIGVSGSSTTSSWATLAAP